MKVMKRGQLFFSDASGSREIQCLKDVDSKRSEIDHHPNLPFHQSQAEVFNV